MDGVTQEVKGSAGGPPWASFLLAGAVTLAVILGMVRVYGLQSERRQESARAELVSQLSVLRARLEHGLTAPLFITRGLVAQIILHDGISDADFARAAHLVIQDYPTVRNLTLARGTVIAAVYPVSANRAALGVDYRDRPDQWPTVERAIATRQPVVAGPVNLIQGGSALIGRVPVFLPDPGGGDAHLFGLISVVIDIDKSFAASGLAEQPSGLELGIRGRDGLGKAGAMVWGSEAVFSARPVEMEVTLPDGTWVMAATPRGGWDQADSELGMTAIMGGLLALLTAAISFGLAYHGHRQHRTGLRVAESEERYRVLMETAPVAVMVHREGIVLFANSFAARLLDAPGSLAGRMALDLVHPDSRGTVAKRVERVLREPDTVSTGPARFVTASGAVIETEMMSTRLSFGGEAAVLSVIRDTTERYRAEAERERLLESLQRSNEDLQQFAYIASHDLQEPLRNVASYVQLLGRRYRGRLDHDADQFITYAVEGTKRMQEMITNLLDYSHLQQNDGEPQALDARLALDDALGNLGTAIEEAGAVIEVVGTMPAILARRVELARVFQNLVGNAIKYRRPDTVPRVQISAVRDGLDWRFTIADNGIGMDPAAVDRIFTLFMRLHTRDTYQGTGIGLAICRKLVQHNGGRIWAESQPGRGSSFHFTLRAAEAAKVQDLA